MKRPFLLLWLAALALGLGAALSEEPADPAAAGYALVLELDGAIGPASAAFVSQGLEHAAAEGAALVILRMDTPGGLDASMRDIIRDILASPVPVASYVHPSGARAASAGTYILYASHIAAMTPGTNLGAATPVQLGGPQQPPPEKTPDKKDDEDSGTDKKPQSPADAKAINDAVAYIRSLAQLRGRNADWAETAVREATSLPANEALKAGVVDVVATGIPDLLTRIDGRAVRLGEREITLATRNLTIEVLEPSWQISLLAAITNPNIALLLMTVGIYGLIFEFMNPGALYPGTIGAICLLLGLYALAALPVNYAGFGLLFLGIALMLAELFAPSFGILGIGGAIAFILGATLLIDSDVPEFQFAWPVVGGVAAASLLFTLVVLRMAVGAHRRQVATGREQMIGTQARVLSWNGSSGHVFVHGERWQARADYALKPGHDFQPGQTVRVTGIDGLSLAVEPLSDAPTPPQLNPTSEDAHVR